MRHTHCVHLARVEMKSNSNLTEIQHTAATVAVLGGWGSSKVSLDALWGKFVSRFLINALKIQQFKLQEIDCTAASD